MIRVLSPALLFLALLAFRPDPQAQTVWHPAVTTFGVLYSRTTGRIRVIYLVDADAQLDAINVPACAGLFRWPLREYATLPELQARVSQATGLVPHEDRYAVVNANGLVTGTLLADPQGCDDHVLGADLVASATAGLGDRYDAATQTFEH